MREDKRIRLLTLLVLLGLFLALGCQLIVRPTATPPPVTVVVITHTPSPTSTVAPVETTSQPPTAMPKVVPPTVEKATPTATPEAAILPEANELRLYSLEAGPKAQAERRMKIEIRMRSDFFIFAHLREGLFF